MNGNEFFLTAAQQLLGIDDLHFGWWQPGQPLDFANLIDAQRRHADYMVDRLVAHRERGRMLDVGCGTGAIMRALLERGCAVDGVVPLPALAARAREAIAPLRASCDSAVFTSRLEDCAALGARRYALAYFSESFQYIDLTAGFAALNACLQDDGRVAIFDFFQRDGEAESMRGGHALSAFYRAVEECGYAIDEDRDLTEHMSPTMDWIHALLERRVLPFTDTVDAYLGSQRHWTRRLLSIPLRAQLRRLKKRHARVDFSAQAFARAKTYRFIWLRRR